MAVELWEAALIIPTLAVKRTTPELLLLLLVDLSLHDCLLLLLVQLLLLALIEGKV